MRGGHQQTKKHCQAHTQNQLMQVQTSTFNQTLNNQLVFVLINLPSHLFTHRAAEVALHQSLDVQLCPEVPAELHQLITGQASCQSLILLHHGPAGVLQDQQTNISRKQHRGRGEKRLFVSPLEGITDLMMTQMDRYEIPENQN